MPDDDHPRTPHPRPSGLPELESHDALMAAALAELPEPPSRWSAPRARDLLTHLVTIGAAGPARRTALPARARRVLQGAYPRRTGRTMPRALGGTRIGIETPADEDGPRSRPVRDTGGRAMNEKNPTQQPSAWIHEQQDTARARLEEHTAGSQRRLDAAVARTSDALGAAAHAIGEHAPRSVARAVDQVATRAQSALSPSTMHPEDAPERTED